MDSLFKIKSARTDALLLQLFSHDIAAISAALAEYFQKFDVRNLPFLLDVQTLDDAWRLDYDALLPVLREKGVMLIGVQHSDPQYRVLLKQYGVPFKLIQEKNPPESGTDAQTLPESQTAPATPAPVKTAAATALLIDKPVRSGQQIYAEGGDLIITALVSQGAEVIADGHIHIYAPLRGRALAGAAGDTSARIFIQSMQAQLVSVAGIYRTFERQLPAALAHRAVCVALEDGGKLNIAAIGTE